ncbi:MAG: hypothetical protein Q8P88_00280 [Candidatus Jorgensenbacteria bacterium]|nr:hypothetical protein [Candidatus Jorgensenbacteria bacterium]
MLTLGLLMRYTNSAGYTHTFVIGPFLGSEEDEQRKSFIMENYQSVLEERGCEIEQSFNLDAAAYGIVSIIDPRTLEGEIREALQRKKSEPSSAAS